MGFVGPSTYPEFIQMKRFYFMPQTALKIRSKSHLLPPQDQESYAASRYSKVPLQERHDVAFEAGLSLLAQIKKQADRYGEVELSYASSQLRPEHHKAYRWMTNQRAKLHKGKLSTKESQRILKAIGGFFTGMKGHDDLVPMGRWFQAPPGELAGTKRIRLNPLQAKDEQIAWTDESDMSDVLDAFVLAFRIHHNTQEDSSKMPQATSMLGKMTAGKVHSELLDKSVIGLDFVLSTELMRRLLPCRPRTFSGQLTWFKEGIDYVGSPTTRRRFYSVHGIATYVDRLVRSYVDTKHPNHLLADAENRARLLKQISSILNDWPIDILQDDIKNFLEGMLSVIRGIKVGHKPAANGVKKGIPKRTVRLSPASPVALPL